MIKLGKVFNIIDSETIQVMDIDEEELYTVKGDRLDISSIKDLSEESGSEMFIDFDDETMEMVV